MITHQLAYHVWYTPRIVALFRGIITRMRQCNEIYMYV